MSFQRCTAHCDLMSDSMDDRIWNDETVRYALAAAYALGKDHGEDPFARHYRNPFSKRSRPNINRIYRVASKEQTR
jgi:hypothetical protein